MTVYAVAESVLDLAPCPFCRNRKFHRNTKAKGYFEKKALERAGKPSSNHLIRCTKCGAKGPLSHSVAEAEAAWNTRIDEPTPSQTVSQDRAVEAVARAIYYADEHPLMPYDDDGEVAEQFREIFRGYARAAIDALAAFKKSEVGHE